MRNNSIFRYVFTLFVVILIGVTIYFIISNRSKTEVYTEDNTSTLSNIQTDIRLAVAGFDTINPLLTQNKNVQEITKVIFDPLVTLNENYKIEYCLAESIDKIDSVTYVINLRKGVLWHDNSNFTSRDVQYTIDLIKQGFFYTIYSQNLSKVVSLETDGDYKLKVSLSEEVPFFEYNLTFPIMCKAFYEDKDFGQTEVPMIGTGMFKIQSVESNIVKLVKNETYWDSTKQIMPTEININLYPSMGEVYSAFKNGEVDVITTSSTNFSNYIGTLGYNKIEYKYRDFDFLTFNTQAAILDDVNVRRAISMVLDKENIVASSLGARICSI